MDNTLALLLADGYKHVHAEQFPKGLTKLVSYMTPRKTRLENWQHMVFFGLQAFCQKYLVDYFDEYFFKKPLETIVEEYTDVLDPMLGKGNYDLRKVIELHKLGYLPITVSGLREGALVPMQVPCIEVTNTDDDFAWVVQWVESLMSCELWKSCIHANVALSYRMVVDKYYDETVDDEVDRTKAISDFGFRGMSSLEEAVKASTAWLTSFSGTATIPAIPYIERYYHQKNKEDHFATNAISTEHSVMASNFSIDGDERTFVKRLLTEVYPHASFSMVSDTYDYWNMVDVILPSLKDEILAHDGKLLIRPDSGDIIDISVKTIQHLWETFGGTVNSKGYKVLDPHIGCVYGDGVTQLRAERIYEELKQLGFAANNIVFGAGSFSFNCIETVDAEGNHHFGPFTRDTLSIAIKATAGVVNGKFIEVFKDPKTDHVAGCNFKKSQRGVCKVWFDKDLHDYRCVDRQTELAVWHPTSEDESSDAFRTYFTDGKVKTEYTLQDVRDNIREGLNRLGERKPHTI